MALQYWMNEEFVEQLMQDQAGVKVRYPWTERLMVDHNSGGRYLRLNHDDLFREYPEVPRIPTNYVAMVTYRGKIYEDFRKQGIYKLNEARLDLKTAYDKYFTPQKKVQHIDIRGPNVESVRSILTRVLSGQLQPVEDFTAGADPEEDEKTQATVNAA